MENHENNAQQVENIDNKQVVEESNDDKIHGKFR